ncbi:peptidoglycan recognition protein 6 [Salminus brasiliensis]|uniref:peptidoglycan recognition protein 6 n=1 Tax=Salminus brasiliensis TaxID=930266 RepID=UPI003B834421
MDSHLRGIVFLLLVVGSLTEDPPPKHMDNFIKAVETIEADNLGLGPLAVVIGLRKAAGIETTFIQNYFGSLSDDSPTNSLVIKPELIRLLNSMIKHEVSELGVEEGVVLTADGITVALTPLLLGLEAGLRSTSPSRVRGLYPLSLTNNLVRSFLHHSRGDSSSSSSRLGPGGCWDNVKDPRVFTLSGVASLATDAQVTGGMDGVILGKRMAEINKHPLPLSSLLKRYYNHRLGAAGLDAAPGLISQLRRTNFRKLVNLPLLERQLMRSLSTVQKLEKYFKRQKVEKKKLEEILNQGLDEFVHSYMDCPAIIPRCMWEAKPYRGTPTQLTLPLSFLYIHHTYGPSQPCLSFQECSRDMRSMQRFHQDDRGWDDIGYSFVTGSDGYLYEGRGWHWRGAHTKGHNSIGYGVSFIGDYTSSIPGKRTMDLVRHQLAKCATDRGRLVSNFTIHGHRQVVNTSCPGDAFYAEIQGWKHFGEVKK